MKPTARSAVPWAVVVALVLSLLTLAFTSPGPVAAPPAGLPGPAVTLVPAAATKPLPVLPSAVSTPVPPQVKVASKPGPKTVTVSKHLITRTRSTGSVVHTRLELRIAPSAYRGKWYDARFEKVRRCIEWRESNGHYDARSNSSTAAGAYQMLRATSNHMAKLIGKPSLAGTSAANWSRYWQDFAFWRLWSHGAGRGAWGGGNWNCW